jgi:FHA domain-containing protein
VITLTVISYNGAPVTHAPSATFDELGGTIGRADTNQLVLDDPDRAVSRVHAQIAFRSGSFAIVNRGSNPIQVNTREIDSGREAPVAVGDRVQIGSFTLSVQTALVSTAGASDDPFASLLDPVSTAPVAGRAGLPDPLASFGADPVPRGSPGGYPRAGAPALPAAGGIPEDWDPFAPDPTPAKPGGDFAKSLGKPGAGGFGLDIGGAAPGPLIPGMSSASSGPGGGDSLDSLFGLKSGGNADPLANSALANPSALPNMAASSDPMQSLNMAPKATAATVSDAFSDLNLPFTAKPIAEPRRPAPPPPPSPPVSAGRPSGAVMSWDDPDSVGHTVIRPSARGGDAAGAPRAAAVPVAPVAASPVVPPVVPPVIPAFDSLFDSPIAAPSAAPSAAAKAAPEPLLAADFDPFAALAPVAPAPPPPAPAPAPQAFVVRAPAPAPAPAPAVAAVPAAPPVAATARAGSADTAALLAAFREGLATPTVQIDALTPELMRLIGQLIHESAKGTVDLLVARAALKREVRAEATMIVARENNPLKFSPSGDAALQHLLSPPTKGFMAAAPAMRDAYDDLRAHQFGFIAGMRAALEGVLQRFDPAVLEGRLTKGSMLQSLLPGSRKARMWEVFTEHYAQISNDASEDFHTLFGKAFLKAYEEHIDQLKGGGA